MNGETNTREEVEDPEAPRLPAEEPVEKTDMAAKIFRLNLGKTSTSSTNSSETTPLLNGCKPCYAYSYEAREETISESASCGSRPTSSCSSDTEHRKQFNNFLSNIKLAILTGILLFSSVALSFIEVHEDNWSQIAVTDDKPASINLSEENEMWDPIIRLKAVGSFLPETFLNFSENFVTFTIVRKTSNGTYFPVVPTWTVPVAPTNHAQAVGSSVVEHSFDLPGEEYFENDVYTLLIDTNENVDYVSLAVDVTVKPESSTDQVLMATFVLVGLYVLIIFDLVHRTLAAMIGATTAIAFLALVGERPSLEEVTGWLDVETLSLLFGMMVLVSVLCETGFFDYIAVVAFRIAHGRVWPLLTCLCLFTALLSAFLDNVTTILLMTPVTIRLCEVMNIDPKHMLIALVIFSNVGGAATPVGDPPNVIIISNPKIAEAGIDFGQFTLHMAPGVLFCIIGTYILIRLMYKDVSSLRYSDPPEVVEIKHEVEIWKKAYCSLSSYSRDEDAVRSTLKTKVSTLKTLLRKKLYDAKVSDETFRANLKELSNTYKIRNVSLLIKSGVVIGVVILFFFLQSIPGLTLSLGWTAILGAITLLILADFDELESIFGRVEWTTLLFFAALFVVMEALSQLKLLLYIGNLTEDIIFAVDERSRLIVAIVLILWISALASCFIDNIPFTTVMVQIVTDIADSEELNLPLTPLVYALAFGACLGGNGTLIGASANVVCAGVAEQHGYRFTFYDFFKVGFPVMLLTTALSTIYLLICHVALDWN